MRDFVREGADADTAAAEVRLRLDFERIDTARDARHGRRATRDDAVRFEWVARADRVGDVLDDLVLANALRVVVRLVGGARPGLRQRALDEVVELQRLPARPDRGRARVRGIVEETDRRCREVARHRMVEVPVPGRRAVPVGDFRGQLAVADRVVGVRRGQVEVIRRLVGRVVVVREPAHRAHRLVHRERADRGRRAHEALPRVVRVEEVLRRAAVVDDDLERRAARDPGGRRDDELVLVRPGVDVAHEGRRRAVDRDRGDVVVAHEVQRELRQALGRAQRRLGARRLEGMRRRVVVDRHVIALRVIAPVADVDVVGVAQASCPRRELGARGGAQRKTQEYAPHGRPRPTSHSCPLFSTALGDPYRRTSVSELTSARANRTTLSVEAPQREPLRFSSYHWPADWILEQSTRGQ